MIVGYDARTPGEIIEGRLFEACHIGIVVAADDVTIRRSRFRRLVSDGTNGCAVAVQQGVSRCQILDCDMDGSEGQADAAAISLYPGTEECVVRFCTIHHWKQAGISSSSTSYLEFQPPLPWSYAHLIELNTIRSCGVGRTGDAGAGIVVIANSHRVITRLNTVRRCGGHGIVYAGCVQGSPLVQGTPAFDQAPTWGQISGNICEYNGGDGIRNAGANYTSITGNFLSANGGAPIAVVGLGGTSNASGVEQSGNRTA